MVMRFDRWMIFGFTNSSPWKSITYLRLRIGLFIMRFSGLIFLFFAGISLTPLAGAAQVFGTGPQATFDGQTVSAIDLIANPHRDIESFRNSVTQQVGEPYSQAKVEASISALQRQGNFEKVALNVVPDISGLRLNFILEPAYYLGMVNFQGADKSFSYARLRQTA